MEGADNVHPSRKNLIRSSGTDARKSAPKDKYKKKTTSNQASKPKRKKKNQPNKPSPQDISTAAWTSPQDVSPVPPAPSAAPVKPRTSHPRPEPAPITPPLTTFTTGFSYIDTAGQICNITASDYASVTRISTADHKPILKSVAVLETILSNTRILHFLTNHPSLDRDMYRCQQFMGMITTAMTKKEITPSVLAQSKTVLETWENLLAQLEGKLAGKKSTSGKQSGIVTALAKAKAVAMEARELAASPRSG